jgi:AraC-like DNA-binding protein
MAQRTVHTDPTTHRPLTRLQKIDTSRLSTRVRPRVKPRGLPPALEDHLVWGTRHPHEAELFGAELLGANVVHITDSRPSDFYASLHAVRLREVVLGYLDFTCEARLEVRQLPPAYFVFVPMSGHSTIHTAPERRPSAETVIEATPILAVLPRPGMPLLVECNRQSPHLLVVIDEQALLVHLSRILGRPLDERLTFDVAFDLSEASASRWNFAIQMLHAELFEPGSLLDRGVGTGQLEEFVMSSLLYAHASNYSEVLNRPGQGFENRTTRAAKDFIERHLAESISVRDIAAAAGVSERTLQAAFKSELSTTPMGYLRDRRLDRARADLADAAAADDVNVTRVAERWGFGHLGRFAADYKARFGESPSRTLRH